GSAADVLLVLPPELRHEVIHQPVVEVFAAEVSVPRGGLHLEDPLLDRQDRDVERPAAEVEDQDVLLLPLGGLLVEPVRDGGGGRLVDDPNHVQPGDRAGVLGGLPLRVVEVGWDGDDGVVDGVAEERLRCLPHLREHHGGDLLGGEPLLLALVPHHDHGLVPRAGDHLERPELHVALDGGVRESPPDQALRVEHRVLRVQRHLVLRRVADQPLRVGERHVGWGRAVALVVGDDLDAVVEPYSYARVRRPEIDSYGFFSLCRH
ncbi:Glutamate dehydrogenase, NAD-specific, partial [Parasponia andersonii]